MLAAQFSALVGLALVFLILPSAHGQLALCSQIWQCPVASISVTYRWTTAPGEDAMINVFNTTGAQEGPCGVIFFVDSTADTIGGVCQGGSIMAWMPTSVMQSVLTTLQSPRYYSYLTWNPFNKLATLTSVAPQASSQRPHDSSLVPSEAMKSVH